MIAYFLPGLAGAAALCVVFWSPKVGATVSAFGKAPSTIGLFLMASAGVLTLGVLLGGLRGLFYEEVAPRCLGARRTGRSVRFFRRFLTMTSESPPSISSDEFRSLGIDEAKLAAYRAAVDEHFRYHQFWGSVSVVLAPFTCWFVATDPAGMSCLSRILVSVFAAFLWWLTVAAAFTELALFVWRAKAILAEKTSLV
ncbi:MAG: hypothetical protein WC683_14900 [bacterium]